MTDETSSNSDLHRRDITMRTTEQVGVNIHNRYLVKNKKKIKQKTYTRVVNYCAPP